MEITEVRLACRIRYGVCDDDICRHIQLNTGNALLRSLCRFTCGSRRSLLFWCSTGCFGFSILFVSFRTSNG